MEENKVARLKISQFAELVGVSISTIRNWEKKGKLKPYRLPSGQRRYKPEMKDELLDYGYKEEK